MSNVQAAIKVADQLVLRIFDQRHFTSGEINYLIKEFGEKANLEENFDKILKINQNVCVISDTSTNDLCKSSDKMAKDICDQVSLLQEKTERLLKIEDERRQKGGRLLSTMREERKNTKQDCYRNITLKLEKLNESLVEEELELERKYLKFEENLRNKR